MDNMTPIGAGDLTSALNSVHDASYQPDKSWYDPESSVYNTAIAHNYRITHPDPTYSGPRDNAGNPVPGLQNVANALLGPDETVAQRDAREYRDAHLTFSPYHPADDISQSTPSSAKPSDTPTDTTTQGGFSPANVGQSLAQLSTSAHPQQQPQVVSSTPENTAAYHEAPAAPQRYIFGGPVSDMLARKTLGVDTQKYLENQDKLQGMSDIIAMRNSPAYHNAVQAGLNAGLPRDVAMAQADQGVSDASGRMGTFAAYGNMDADNKAIAEARDRGMINMALTGDPRHMNGLPGGTYQDDGKTLRLNTPDGQIRYWGHGQIGAPYSHDGQVMEQILQKGDLASAVNASRQSQAQLRALGELGRNIFSGNNGNTPEGKMAKQQFLSLLQQLAPQTDGGAASQSLGGSAYAPVPQNYTGQ